MEVRECWFEKQMRCFFGLFAFCQTFPWSKLSWNDVCACLRMFIECIRPNTPNTVKLDAWSLFGICFPMIWNHLSKFSSLDARASRRAGTIEREMEYGNVTLDDNGLRFSREVLVATDKRTFGDIFRVDFLLISEYLTRWCRLCTFARIPVGCEVYDEYDAS